MSVNGLTGLEAKKRLKQYGLNILSNPYEVKFFAIVKEEVTEPMILLLFVVGFFYALWGKLEDAVTIFVIIFLLVSVEIFNEYRAKKAIASLSVLAAPKSRVLREGEIVSVLSEEIVPGDILILSAGTRLAADAKILSGYSLEADESSLTGESVPVLKEVNSSVFAGTLIVSGEAKAEVLTTGAGTRFGKISLMAKAIKPPKTPLQLSMKSLAKNLVFIALFFSISIPLLGILRGNDLRQMILTGLALAFATIPEELPIIITIILGLGAYKLSNQSFLVKKIKAAEVLGDATVILTDKTGTITENKMSVASVYPKSKEEEIVRTASLALTQASLSPTDNALRSKANELKIQFDDENIIRERGFDSKRKTKSVLIKEKNKLVLVMIGAPEEVAGFAKSDVSEFQRLVSDEAAKGRRVIAVAKKLVSNNMKGYSFSRLENGLEMIGLLSIEDAPRRGVKDTILLAKSAGVRTIMVTGDHPLTAKFVADSVGISADTVVTGEELDRMSEDEIKKVVMSVSVFARTTPEHKYLLVKALHANNEVVAVTGDGVNDALALKGSDIGIAMGIKGTDAAKEAAEVVLADDNYVTIGKAIFEARSFYENLRKGVGYYLSVKAALVLVFLLPILAGLALPFAPIQIIILELFMDLAASAGFVAEPKESIIYTKEYANKSKKFIDDKMIKQIIISGLSLFSAVMASYFYALSINLPVLQAQTFAFFAWIIGHVLLALVSRSQKEPLLKIGVFSNKIMNLWILAVALFLIIANFVPVATAQLKLEQLPVQSLGLIFCVSFAAIFLQEIIKSIRFYFSKQKNL